MKLKKLLGAVGTISTAMVIAGCGGGGSGSGVEYVAFDAPAISASQKKEFLDAVNEARAVGRTCGKYGYMPAASPLKWDDRLYNAAYEHSEDMAMSNMYTAHDGTGTEHDWTAQVLDLGRGSTYSERAKNNGLKNIPGENVAAGYFSTAEVMDGWLSSEGHCRNIMDSRLDTLGMAFVENDNSEWKVYWTQEIGKE